MKWTKKGKSNQKSKSHSHKTLTSINNRIPISTSIFLELLQVPSPSNPSRILKFSSDCLQFGGAIWSQRGFNLVGSFEGSSRGDRSSRSIICWSPGDSEEKQGFPGGERRGRRVEGEGRRERCGRMRRRKQGHGYRHPLTCYQFMAGWFEFTYSF